MKALLNSTALALFVLATLAFIQLFVNVFSKVHNMRADLFLVFVFTSAWVLCIVLLEKASTTK